MCCLHLVVGSDRDTAVRKQKQCGIRKKGDLFCNIFDADKSGSRDFAKESTLLLGNLLLCFWSMYLLTNPQFSLENRSEKKDVFLNCFLSVKKYRETDSQNMRKQQGENE